MKILLPGLALAVAVALASQWASQLGFWPFKLADGRQLLEPAMLAILVGIALANALRLPKSIDPGVKFAVKKVLPIGIVFLGARLDMNEVLRVGLNGVLLTVGVIVLAMAAAWRLGKAMGVAPKLAALLGVGSAICGGSAIVATAPVIEANDQDVAMSVSIVSLLGAGLMLLLPALAAPFELSDAAFGHWAGLSIPQTPQVVAAGAAHSATALDLATIVKLARVCMLAPMLVVIGVVYSRASHRAGGAKLGLRWGSLVPLFVWGFLLMSLLASNGLIGKAPLSFVEEWTPLSGKAASPYGLCDLISKACMLVAMAGVGLETRWSSFKAAGARPLWLGAACLGLVTAASLAAVKGLGL